MSNICFFRFHYRVTGKQITKIISKREEDIAV